MAAALLAYLFRDSLLRGYVLGQADILFDYLPWQPYKPVGSRIHNRVLSDVPTVFYPFLFHARETVLEGRFPLWSSGIAAGHPFFASFQTALLSPFTQLHYLLPFPASLTADVAARLMAGGVGMYLFLRSLPVSRSAAAFGGIAYLLNPFSVVWLEHPLSAVAACLPWVLLSIDICARRLDGRSAAAVAAATAVTLVTGHPETAFKIFLLAGAYTIYRGVLSGRVVRTTVVVTSGMALGAIITAVQLIPFLEYARESRILAARQESAVLLSSPLSAFVTAFVPDFYGTPLRNRFVLGGTNYNEMQLYPGIVTWLFAPLALLHTRHRGRAVCFVIAGVLAILIMYGTPLARFMRMVIPALQVAALSRFGLIAIAGVIIASAIGFDALFEQGEGGQRKAWLRPAIAVTVMAMLMAMTVAAFLSSQRQLLMDMRQWTATIRATTHAAELVAASLLVTFVVLTVRHRFLVILPITLLSIDLLGFADGFHTAIPKVQSFPRVPELAAIQADRNVVRVAGWHDTLLPNTALVYGLQDFRGYDGIGVRYYTSFLDVGFRFNGATHELVNMATPHLLDFLNIKYVLTPAEIALPPDRFRLLHDGPTRVYLNLSVQPRAFLVDDYTVLDGDEARRAMRAGLDLTRAAIMARSLDADLEPQRASGVVGTARILEYADESVVVTTRADGRRLLVLSDVFYPGWVATVDDAEVPIHRTNYAFRGVSVPAGEHTVTFSYRPASVEYGRHVSLAGIAMFLLLLGRGRLRPLSRPSTP
ncbi:MAG: YfhO family protein [Acidobacteria bacterium]|nr:YfhO family protein [Acidobacteriota bacterium]